MLTLVLDQGIEVALTLPPRQSERLTTTCFRGLQKRFAGNFFSWSCFRDFIRDREVREVLAIHLKELVAEGGMRDARLELVLEHDVGWDSAMEVGQLYPDELARCTYERVNTHANAYFAPPEVEACKTNVVTMVATVRPDMLGWLCIINTIYPGWDCGPMEGEITEKRGLVLLHWTNPGEK